MAVLSDYTFCCELLISALLYLYKQDFLDSDELQVGREQLKSTTWNGKVNLALKQRGQILVNINKVILK